MAYLIFAIHEIKFISRIFLVIWLPKYKYDLLYTYE